MVGCEYAAEEITVLFFFIIKVLHLSSNDFVTSKDDRDLKPFQNIEVVLPVLLSGS